MSTIQFRKAWGRDLHHGPSDEWTHSSGEHKLIHHTSKHIFVANVTGGGLNGRHSWVLSRGTKREGGAMPKHFAVQKNGVEADADSAKIAAEHAMEKAERKSLGATTSPKPFPKGASHAGKPGGGGGPKKTAGGQSSKDDKYFWGSRYSSATVQHRQA